MQIKQLLFAYVTKAAHPEPAEVSATINTAYNGVLYQAPKIGKPLLAYLSRGTLGLDTEQLSQVSQLSPENDAVWSIRWLQAARLHQLG